MNDMPLHNHHKSKRTASDIDTRRDVHMMNHTPPRVAWLHSVYGTKTSLFCWSLTTAVVIISVIMLSFGGYYIQRAANGSYQTEADMKREMDPSRMPSARKLVQVIGAGIATGAGLVVNISFLCSSKFRSFAFPGVAQLCLCHFILDLMRLMQLILHFAHKYPGVCVRIHFVYYYFQPGTILWVGAIAINLLLTVRASSDENQLKTVRSQKWLHFFIWVFCMISTSVMTDPYVGDRIHHFIVERSSGVCIGRSYGMIYSYVMLPSTVLVFSALVFVAFRRKVALFYPKKTSQNINFRSNQYLWTYAFTWAMIIVCFCILHYVGDGAIASSPAYAHLRIFAFFVYHIQGLLYSIITIREFVLYCDGEEVGLHLHNVDISELDFGDREKPEILGEGSFAVVFKAKWENRIVAVKVFRLRHVDMEQMKMEAYMASKLEHPNLIKTFGCGLVDDTNMAIVTEYMGRGTMDDIIFSNKSIPYKRVLHYGRMIATGMDFLHNQNPAIVHRDLKPSNCLVNKMGIIKIADFGCSRWIIEDAASMIHHGPIVDVRDCSRTMTSNIGTPCWTAPELMADPGDSGQAQYSLKVDVYSFSIIMWQLLTGKMPFEEVNGSLLHLEEKVIEGHRPTIPENCPDLMHKLLMYGWDANPDKRPSFREMLHLIELELMAIGLQEKCTGRIQPYYTDDPPIDSFVH